MSSNLPEASGRSPVSADGAHKVEVQLLGPLRIVVAGASVTPQAARAQRLLTLLALNANSTVAADHIVDTVWGSEPPESVRQQLHNVVALSRRSLAPAGQAARVITTGPGYKLILDDQCIDAVRFQNKVLKAKRAEAEGLPNDAKELLRAALDEWHGPALSGLDGELFKNFAAELEDHRLTAFERLAQIRFQLADYAVLVQELSPLVPQQPFREPLRALLMKGLYQAGRQADAIAIYEDGRRLLSEELGLEPSLDLREAHEYVLRGTVTEQDRPRKPTRGEPEPLALSGADPIDRSYLPRDIAEFTGRHEQIRRIQHIVSNSASNAPTIISLNGLGGVGKTSLAVHVAHKLASEYPDGQYFLDLSGYSEVASPLDPGQALVNLLRASGADPELIPSSMEERSALWRSRTANLKMIVLLDNAKDAAQVRPLLPSGREALVLISSRRRFGTLEGASSLFLDVLHATEALHLFRSIVRIEPTETGFASEVVELCGRLPLAIQVAAARLRDRPGWSVSYLAGQLRDQQSRARLLDSDDRSVSNILAWSYEKLNDTPRRVFRVLGGHPGPELDGHAIAALADLPLVEAIAAAEELCDANLLRQPLQGRYQIHDLVGDCSRKLSSLYDGKPMQHSVLVRAIAYYLHAINAWCCQISPAIVAIEQSPAPPPLAVRAVNSRSEAIDALDVEYENIIATAQAAAQSGLHDKAWELICSLRRYYGARNFSGDAERHLQLAVEYARTSGDTRGKLLSLTCLASLKRAQAQTGEAASLLAEAIEISRLIGDHRTEVWQLAELGSIQYDDGLIDEASSTFSAGLALARAHGYHRPQISMINNLGNVAMGFGHLKEARKLFLDAIGLCRESDGLRYRIPAMVNLGFILLFEGDTASAHEHFAELCGLSRKAGIAYGEQYSQIGLAQALRALGRYGEAIGVARAALELANLRNDLDIASYAMNTIGDTQLSMGDPHLAQGTFDRARADAQSRNNSKHLVRAFEGLAHLEGALGHTANARSYWDQVISEGPGNVDYLEGAVKHRKQLGSFNVTCWRCNKILLPD